MDTMQFNNDAEFIPMFDALNLGHPQGYYPNLPSDVDLTARLIIELISYPVSYHVMACDNKDSFILLELIKQFKRSSFLMQTLTWTLALDFVSIACNKSGMRVIRYCFKELNPDDNRALCEQMTEHYLELATNQLGCILLNDCMPYLGRFYMDSIFENIVTDCQALAQHHYGTYVVQNAIRVQHPRYTLSIVENLRSIILRLATQKEGSHLVEKCLVYSSTKKIVMEELTSLSIFELRYLATHVFGNFVVQKALVPSIDGESLEVRRLTLVLGDALYKIRKDLQWHPNGRNVYRKLKCRVVRSSWSC